MADLNAIVEELSKLSVLEAAELAKKLEEKWGVSAAAPVAVAGPAAVPGRNKNRCMWHGISWQKRRSGETVDRRIPAHLPARTGICVRTHRRSCYVSGSRQF